MGMARAVVIPMIGLWISAGAHSLATSSGGSYIIASGALLFGGIRFLARVGDFISAAPKVNQMIREEKLSSVSGYSEVPYVEESPD